MAKINNNKKKIILDEVVYIFIFANFMAKCFFFSTYYLYFTFNTITCEDKAWPNASGAVFVL